MTIDVDSLAVLEGKGGVKPLSENDKGDIKKNMDKVLGRGDITFESTGVSGSLLRLQLLKGDLTINGQSRPVTLNLTVNDNGHVSGTTSFKQTDFGLKLFSAMMGALKVKDNVDISVEVDLPTA